MLLFYSDPPGARPVINFGGICPYLVSFLAEIFRKTGSVPLSERLEPTGALFPGWHLIQSLHLRELRIWERLWETWVPSVACWGVVAPAWSSSRGLECTPCRTGSWLCPLHISSLPFWSEPPSSLTETTATASWLVSPLLLQPLSFLCPTQTECPL